MKLFNKIFISLGVAAASMGLGSCVDDLDLMPTNPSDFTADKFASDPARYMDEVLANMYSAFATQGFTNDGKGPVTQLNPGFAVFNRAVFNLEEIPTDEACWLSATDLEFGQIQYGIPTAATEAVSGCYARLTANITLCNDFISTVNKGYFFLDTDELNAKAKDYVRQAKILRSAAYFYFIDLFGNVPYADESTDVGAVPAQRTRAEVYDLVVRTLEDVVAEYAAENYPRAKYGFVGVDAAQALLVKFYLNAEVYTGTAQWSKCLETAKALINRHKGAGFKNSGLCMDYHQNFAYNNDKFAIGGEGAVNEILWTIPYEQPQLLTWGGTTLLINAWLGSPKVGLNGTAATCDPGRVNSRGAWSCMVGREEFSRIFDWNETMTASPDKRVRFWYTAADGFNVQSTNIGTTDQYGNNGYVPVKYNNWIINDDGSISADSPEAMDQSATDYCMIRLAEIYLSAAEAILHGAGSPSDALEYTNYIRERAGLTPWQATELNLNSLQEERQRELYSENCRRTDLIRYGKYTSGYNWSWKNRVRNGADLPDHYALYPLPDFVVNGAGYKQNTGY